MIHYDPATESYRLHPRINTAEEAAVLDAFFKHSEMGWHKGGDVAKIEYDSDSHTLWLASSDPIIEARLDAIYVRQPGLLRWQLDSQTIWQKVKDVGAALLSGRLAEDDPIVLQRKASCFGPPEKCDALRVEADGAWCRACSCGMTKLANIDGTNSKLTFRTLKCPKMKAGFSNAQS